MAGEEVDRISPDAKQESKGTLRWLFGAAVVTVAGGLFADRVWWAGSSGSSTGARVRDAVAEIWPEVIAGILLLSSLGWVVVGIIKTVRWLAVAVATARERRRWVQTEADVALAPTPGAESELLEEFWSPSAVTAWRAWAWTGTVLHGVWQPWESPSFVAECWECGSVPATEHTCGIYAFKEPSEVVAMTGGQSGLVIGRVELSGLVIEHERGYRAERVRMVELMAAPSIAAAVEARYPDVPVRPELLEGMIDG